MITTSAIISLLVLVGLLIYLVIKKSKHAKALQEELNNIKNRYSAIIDIDHIINEKDQELNILKNNLDNLKTSFENQRSQLNQDFQSKRNLYESLLKEISILEENLENISYGLYKPHYNYSTSEDFKSKLDQARFKQKLIIKDEKATHCPIEWTVEGSKEKGAKMIKEASKLMLRAFNGECDAAIAKVSWNNISNMEARIRKAFDALNKLGSTNKISITDSYFNLKLEELYLEFELEEKLHQEKEEQRRIKEQMREEEKALREIEKAQKEAEEEEKRFEKALEKAKQQLNTATGQELDKLNLKIQELEESLLRAHQQKERALSMAQMTKSGHVYIISNIGSFGENIFKIGMTRRLEPMDRVKELGDASVPFEFDVHAIIFSENAPELENILHKKFEQKRINLVNLRREFFGVTLGEIEQVANEMNLNFNITKLAEAKEYRETISIKEAKLIQMDIQPAISGIEKELEKFPTTL